MQRADQERAAEAEGPTPANQEVAAAVPGEELANRRRVEMNKRAARAFAGIRQRLAAASP